MPRHLFTPEYKKPTLISLKTDLKSLKYGNDRPGGGDSGLPYVQFPLPENANGDFLEYYENNRTNLDFPIRGGGFNLGVVGPYVSQAAKYDKLRIQRFLKSSPEGKIFILKQQALQLANPKIQVGAQINLDLGVLPFRFVGNLENTRIYNGGKNTLAQVAVEGSGIHFDRHGLVPINPYQQTYIYVADDRKDGVNSTYLNNRLYNLYKTKIENQDRIRLDTEEVSIATLNSLGISRNPDLLFQYPGGPSSVGGIGLTTIPRSVNSYIPTERSGQSYKTLSVGLGPTVEQLYSQVILGENATFLPKSPIALYQYQVDNTTVIIPRETTTAPSNIVGTVTGSINVQNLSYTLNYKQLQAAQSQASIGVPNIKADFRKSVTANSQQAGRAVTPAQGLASTEGYESTNNIAQKYGIGSPGAPNFKRVKYNESVDLNDSPISITQDKVNMLDVGQNPDVDGQKDLIRFVFESVEVDKQAKLGTPWSIPLVFRAFLTSLQDNHSAEYNPIKYVGRGENFYAYNGFTREISFNFKIAAQSRPEMQILYRKFNYLLSFLYPDYQQNPQTGFMRAPLSKVTIGDYIVKQPGFLRSLNVTVPDESPWEIANNEIPGADDKMYQLPHILEVSCQFTPIHNFLPRRSWVDGSNIAHITPLVTPNTPGRNHFDIGIL
jgi:hypothetical protein